MLLRWFQTDPALRVPACECIQSIVCKGAAIACAGACAVGVPCPGPRPTRLLVRAGMDCEQRVKLLVDMGLVQLIAYVSSTSNNGDDDHEFLLGTARRGGGAGIWGPA